MGSEAKKKKKNYTKIAEARTQMRFGIENGKKGPEGNFGDFEYGFLRTFSGPG